MEKITADVIIERKNDLPMPDVSGYVKVTGIAIGKEGSQSISFTYNGRSFDYPDLKTGVLTKLEEPNLSKIGRTGMVIYTPLAFGPYCQKNPFEPTLNTLKEAVRLEDTVIFNQPCFAVKIIREIHSELMGKQQTESVFYFEKKRFLFCGSKSRYGQQFLKIKSVDSEIPENTFNLAGKAEVKTITGLEPNDEGLLTTGSAAPLWSLPSSENKTIHLKDLKGKVVLLDFWGTWCMPCLKAMPDIQAIHEKFKNQPVVILGVSVEMEKSADPVAYMKKKKYSYTTLLDGHTITKDYKVHEFPTIYLIDKKGLIIHAEHSGSRENFREDIIQRINKALKNE